MTNHTISSTIISSMNTNCPMLDWDAIIHSYLSRANSFSWLASWEARAWAVRVGPEIAPWGWARWPENLPFADRRCFFVVGLLLLLCPFRHRVALPALGPLTLVLTLPLAIMVVHVAGSETGSHTQTIASQLSTALRLLLHFVTQPSTYHWPAGWCLEFPYCAWVLCFYIKVACKCKCLVGAWVQVHVWVWVRVQVRGCGYGSVVSCCFSTWNDFLQKANEWDITHPELPTWDYPPGD